MPRKKQSIHDQLKAAQPKALRRVLDAERRLKAHAEEDLGPAAEVTLSWVTFNFKAEIRLPALEGSPAAVVVQLMHPDLTTLSKLAHANIALMQVSCEEFLDGHETSDDFATTTAAEDLLANYVHTA